MGLSRSGVRPIIKAALRASGALWCLLVLPPLAACDLNPPEPADQSRVVVQSPAPSPSPSPTPVYVWTLWPLGVNVHQSPAATSPLVGGLQQATQLIVQATQTVAGKTWLKVSETDPAGLKGWVLDDPDLVIHRAVNLHIDSDQSWSMLFPAEWNVQAPGAPTGQTTLTGGGITMVVDVERAPPRFTPPGADLQDQEVELYGKTTVLSTYRTAAGYELLMRVRWDALRFFTITYTEPAAPQPDTSLFLQLMTSIKID